ncbi:MAG TPA: 50S ribosomal protein L4 [Prolixibacteraceae bacterium]|jgi:large subunit ribosomal protein L4|nr:50S ribosomal protein L4 [Prolixibacteraceae bacterium]
MEIAVFNKAGQETGRNVELNTEIYAVEPNDHAIYLDVKQYLANQRQGTHKAKDRGEIAGSTRKIKRQKGTGGARAGSRKSGTIRGGGRIFGPQPRDYSFKLNKKLKELARKSALTYKAQASEILVMEDFSFDAPKTKEFVAIQNNLKISDKKLLIVLPEANKNIYLSSRNLQNVEIVIASELSTYKIMRAQKIILVESSVIKVEELFKI